MADNLFITRQMGGTVGAPMAEAASDQYPKYLHHPTEPPVLIQTAEEEQAYSTPWRDRIYTDEEKAALASRPAPRTEPPADEPPPSRSRR